MKPREKRIYKRILRQFKNVEPGKNLLQENDNIKRIDLENSTLCLNEKGKLYTDKLIYFSDKDTCYCLFFELQALEKELLKLG